MYTDKFIEETLKVESAEVSLVMLKLTHDDWTGGAKPDPIRIVGNTSAITTTEGLYQPYGVSFALPSEGASSVGTTITVEDITRVLSSQLRAVLNGITIEIFVILASDPNTVEIDVGSFEVTSIQLSNYQLQLSVEQKTILNNSLSSNTINPTDFPGVFLL